MEGWEAEHRDVEAVSGPAYDTARERRKTSKLVAALATLFDDAAEGRVEDAKLAERVNAWLPANLRESAVDGR